MIDHRKKKNKISLLPRKHYKQRDTKGPNVTGGIIALLFEDFRRRIMSCVAGSHEQAVLVSQLLGKAKVNYANGLWPVAVVGIQYIRRFQIAVHDTVAVQIVDGVYDHAEYRGGLFLGEKLFLYDLVKQLAALAQLEDQIDFGSVQEYLLR